MAVGWIKLDKLLGKLGVVGNGNRVDGIGEISGAGDGGGKLLGVIAV